ncbi:MAG: FAD-binding oxidoreductase, partial [Micromonosporaceae bacterium]
IAQCANLPDVLSALAFARDHKLPISVRSGGHGVAGAALVDDGLVIDMREINSVIVDPVARTAVVGGGATWSDVDRATTRYGLATTGGRVSTTGVAGLTLGGGSGWVERKFGLACDNLLEVEIVTANGQVVTANAKQNPNLFWALHGGGGNFGVATSFTFQLHEAPAITMALLFFSPDNGPEVVRRYRDFIATAPDEIGGGIIYLTGPPEEFVPEHLVGNLTLGMLVTYVGDEASAREVISPLLALQPDGQMIAQVPYAELQSSLDDPPGYRNYWSVEYLADFPDDAVEKFCDRAYDMVVPSPSQQALLPWGGAVARGGMSALADRQAKWAVHPLGLWEDAADDTRGIAWARNLNADMKPYATGAVYLNFIGDEGAERVVAGFGRDNYRRLAAIKAEWDPENVFRQNHNIAPDAPGD